VAVTLDLNSRLVIDEIVGSGIDVEVNITTIDY
jgi:hypothetical protein